MENTTASKKIENQKPSAAGTVHAIKSEADNLLETGTKYASRARDISEQAAKKSVDFIKRHPVQSAVGALAIGYITGSFLRRRK